MKKTTKVILWVIIILVIIIVGVYFFKGNLGKNTVNIGMITPLTGSFAQNGTEAKNAALLAADDINRNGGVLGNKINIIVEDGKCDASTALDDWNQLVQIDKLNVILGGHCSSESLAIAPLSAKDHVLTLPNITSASTIVNEGEWVFRNSTPSQYTGAKAADYIVKNVGLKDIGVITEIKDFPKTYSDFFIKNAMNDGAKIVYSEQFDSGTTDFRSIISKIKDMPVDAILISTQGAGTAGLISKQLSEMGLEKTQIYNPGFDFTSFKAGSSGYVPKKFIDVTGYANPTDLKVANFVNEYQQKYGEPITYNLYYISAVYDMVYRVKNAMVACNSTTDIECIRSQFKNVTEYDGVSGKIPVSSEYSPKSALMPLGLLSIDSDGKVIVNKLPVN